VAAISIKNKVIAYRFMVTALINKDQGYCVNA